MYSHRETCNQCCRYLGDNKHRDTSERLTHFLRICTLAPSGGCVYCRHAIHGQNKHIRGQQSPGCADHFAARTNTNTNTRPAYAQRTKLRPTAGKQHRDTVINLFTSVYRHRRPRCFLCGVCQHAAAIFIGTTRVQTTQQSAVQSFLCTSRRGTDKVVVTVTTKCLPTSLAGGPDRSASH